MSPRTTRKALVLALCSAAALLLLVGGASALVKVYSNDFSKPADAESLVLTGKSCASAYNPDLKVLGVLAHKGPARCRLKVPVQGDSPQPNQTIQVTTKLAKDTPKSIARRTYFAVTLRDGAGGLYEFRVYSAIRRYSLVRTPDANGFPVTGRDRDISKPGDRNFITLSVDGDTIRPSINGKPLDPITDSNASELAGRRMTVTFGVEGKSPGPIAGWIDDVLVQVPTP